WCMMAAANGWAGEAQSRAAAAPKVTMYAKADCGYCAKARAWFEANDVAFDERDIGESAQAEAEWKANGGVGTPLILVGDEKIHGFDAARIARLLQQADAGA